MSVHLETIKLIHCHHSPAPELNSLQTSSPTGASVKQLVSGHCRLTNHSSVKPQIKGIMRILCTCLVLLLLLLSPVVLSQNFDEFKKKHILPLGSHKCDDMMKTINGENQCKSINTFIKKTANEMKALCEKKKNGCISEKFKVIDCKRKCIKPCTYEAVNHFTSKKIKCENGLPVHLTC